MGGPLRPLERHGGRPGYGSGLVLVGALDCPVAQNHGDGYAHQGRK